MTSSQLSTMVSNVMTATISAKACFALTRFLASAASIMAMLSYSLDSSALLKESASDAHSVMERAKIFRSSPASDSPWRITASVKNGGSRTVLREVQSRCFLDCARSPATAQRRPLVIGKRFFSPLGKGDLEIERDDRK